MIYRKISLGTSYLRILDALGYFPNRYKDVLKHLSYCVHVVNIKLFFKYYNDELN